MINNCSGIKRKADQAPGAEAAGRSVSGDFFAESGFFGFYCCSFAMNSGIINKLSV
jgi:hypothetical protein